MLQLEDYSPNFMQAGARPSGPPATAQFAAAAARGGLGTREPAGTMAELTANPDEIAFDDADGDQEYPEESQNVRARYGQDAGAAEPPQAKRAAPARGAAPEGEIELDL
jgi:hypothetical protein